MSNIEIITNKASKKKICVFTGIALVIILLAVIGIVAYSNAPAVRLQKRLDLGNRYLSEMEYEKAIAEYEAVIEIDPKNAEAYLGLSDAYIEMGEYEKASAILEEGYTITGVEIIQRKLEEVNTLLVSTTENIPEEPAEVDLDGVIEEVRAQLPNVSIAFTMDSVVLGETDMSGVKAEYIGKPYAKSNLMNNDTLDTVYVCYGHDTPIPEGNEEDEFGFFFASLAEGGNIVSMNCHDKDILCSQLFYVGDPEEELFHALGITSDIVGRKGSITNDDRELTIYSWKEGYFLKYVEGDRQMTAGVRNGKIYTVGYSYTEYSGE